MRGLGCFTGVLLYMFVGVYVVQGPSYTKGPPSDWNRAKVQMNIISQSVERYFTRYDKLPERLEQLAEDDPHVGGSIMDVLPSDPWGNPFSLERVGETEFRIRSRGPDHERGTDDDLVDLESVAGRR